MQAPDRLLSLLWRRAVAEPPGSGPARGPKQRSSTDEVVTAAVALADGDGLDSLSLRKVADRLGLKVMSLYTYVPGRDELIALMTDQVVGDRPFPPLSGSARERLEVVARFEWDEYRLHPWLLHLPAGRPVLGPNGTARYEWQLHAVDGVGLDDIAMDQTIALVAVFVQGAARAADDVRRTREASDLTDREWWEANAPILERLMDPTAFPLAGRVGTTTGEAYDAPSDPERTFEFGLQRLLDGVDALISTANPPR